MSDALLALRDRVERLFAAGAGADREAARAAFAELREALSRGEARAAEPDPASPTGWRVNAWVKQGILLGFRHGDLADASMDHGRLPVLRQGHAPPEAPRRSRPGCASSPAARRCATAPSSAGASSACRPMYVNVGAYVDEGTMIDSHALVGSCAQVGKRVHVSAGAQIGGVLEPVGALPVCVEDDVLLGGLTGLFEGAVVKRRAVIGGGHDPHRLDARLRPPERPHPAAGGRLAARHPRGRGRGARGAGGDGGRRARLGPVARHPGHRQVPRREDGRPHGARSVAALSLLDLARDAHRHRLDDRARGRGLRVAGRIPPGTRLPRHGAAGLRRPRRTSSRSLDPKPAVVLSTHIDCVPPFFPSRVEGGRLYGRGACDAKGALAAQVTAVERLRESGEERVGLLFVVGEERGSDGAAAANAISPGPAFLVNGEPTESKLGLATRGAFRVKLRATGRAAHSSQPERGISAIDLLIDALVELRGIALPEDPQLGRTFYATGLISGGIAPNVISPSAEAELNFRTVGPGSEVLERLAPLRSRVALETVLEVPPVRMRTVPGFETAAFAFTTDIPLLDRWGEPLLFGPGSILDAHTDGEHVEIEELEAAAVGLRADRPGAAGRAPGRPAS